MTVTRLQNASKHAVAARRPILPAALLLPRTRFCPNAQRKRFLGNFISLSYQKEFNLELAALASPLDGAELPVGNATPLIGVLGSDDDVRKRVLLVSTCYFARLDEDGKFVPLALHDSIPGNRVAGSCLGGPSSPSDQGHWRASAQGLGS